MARQATATTMMLAVLALVCAACGSPPLEPSAAPPSTAAARGELLLTLELTAAPIEGGFLRLRVLDRNGDPVHDAAEHIRIPTPDEPLQERRATLPAGRYRFELSALMCGPEGCAETIDVESVSWHTFCSGEFQVAESQMVRRMVVTDLAYCRVTEAN